MHLTICFEWMYIIKFKIIQRINLIHAIEYSFFLRCDFICHIHLTQITCLKLMLLLTFIISLLMKIWWTNSLFTQENVLKHKAKQYKLFTDLSRTILNLTHLHTKIKVNKKNSNALQTRNIRKYTFYMLASPLVHQFYNNNNNISTFSIKKPLLTYFKLP